MASPNKRAKLSLELKRELIKDSIKVDLPEGWHCAHDSVLIYHHKSPKPSSKVAGFDFDGCLANTKFGNDPNAWKIRYENVGEKLKALVETGYKVVIFTNESMDRLKSQDSVTKAVLKKTGRVQGFLKHIDLPAQVFCMVKKDEFRKPFTKAWDLMVSELNDEAKLALEDCFYVGDAAGRPRDHDDCDKEFAKNVGVTFHTDDSYFRNK